MSPEPRTRSTAPPIVVREAKTSDLEAVLRLAAQDHLLETGIAEGFDGFLVAESDELIVGSCGLEQHSGAGLLRTVVVASELRRRGIGTSLVEAAMGRAREHGLRAMYLLTTTAQAFFAERGFELAARESAPVGIRESWEFAAGCPGTAVLMRRET